MKVIDSPKILHKTNPDGIQYFKAVSNYTYITFQNGQRELSSYSLKVFADIFPDKQFIRINRSLLVNTSFVKKHLKTKGKECLQLKDNTTVVIPRRKSESLKMAHPNLFNN